MCRDDDQKKLREVDSGDTQGRDPNSPTYKVTAPGGKKIKMHNVLPELEIDEEKPEK